MLPKGEMIAPVAQSTLPETSVLEPCVHALTG
jgi:hypothetical protein